MPCDRSLMHELGPGTDSLVTVRATRWREISRASLGCRTLEIHIQRRKFYGERVLGRRPWSRSDFQ